jgi:hypothetical protein
MFQDIYPPVNTDSIMARWGNLPLRISGIVPKFDYLRPVKRTIKFALNTGYTVTDHFTRSLFPAGLDVLGISTGFNALRVLPVNQQNLFSQWAVEWLKYKKSQALQAKILPNRQKYFNILREITEMPLYQLDGPFDEQFNSIKSEMIGYLSEAQNLVGVQSLILGDQAAGVNVSVLSQGIPAKYYAHPSDILLTGLHSEHSWYYGLLQQVSTPQRVTRLILQGILQVDPLTNSSINEALEKEFGANLESEPLSGLKYEIEGVTGDGIKRFDALVNGGLINVTIDIEPTTEAIERIMFRLATIGLPYYLKWTLPGHPTQQGIFGPLQLSINRRTSGLIHVDGKKIVNGEKTSAAHVRYVRTSKGRILPFKEVRVAPKSSVTLNDFDLENDEKLVDVPDLGIRYEEKDFNSTASNFLVINEGSIFNQLTVKNIIQATITIPGSGLTYPVESIEVFVTLIDPDTQAQRPIAHFLLSPNNLPNSTVVIPTISLSTNTYRITGQVHLIGGIVQLKPQDSKLPDITISEDDINY